MNEDGTFNQAEITSCGLNGGPLEGKGEYEARIACHLMSRKGVKFYTVKTPKGVHPYFTQSGEDREENGDQYIANFSHGAVAGFKYFDFKDASGISVKVRGKADGVMTVTDGLGGETVARIKVKGDGEKTYADGLKISDGVRALYFKFEGKGKFDFISFTLE